MEMDSLPAGGGENRQAVTEWRLYDEKRRGMIKAEIRARPGRGAEPEHGDEIMSKSPKGGGGVSGVMISGGGEIERRKATREGAGAAETTGRRDAERVAQGLRNAGGLLE